MAHTKVAKSVAKKFVNDVTKTAIKNIKQRQATRRMVINADVADHIKKFTGGKQKT